MANHELTSEQLNILEHDISRNARILAGPGTGKSTTLIALIDKLLTNDRNLKVKMLTFTRAATNDLAEKLEEKLEQSPRPSTIHSFSISILLRNTGTGGFPEPLRIPDDWENKNIILPSLALLVGVRVKRLKELILEMASNWESLGEKQETGISEEERNRFRGAWAEHRQVFGYTLLAELPFAFRRALENHDDLNGVDFDLLLVDEYQDLNACDLRVLKLISQKTNCTVIATGDDDQSIYSWRNAAPEGIRRFLTEYEPADDYPLSITLRCGKKIIEWANFVISQDPDRPQDKFELRTVDGTLDGQVALLAFDNDNSEAKGVARLVRSLIDQKDIQQSEILVLLRGDYNRAFSKLIRAELDKLEINSFDPNYVKEILQVKDNRKLIAILRLLVSGEDSLAWATLLKLTRGVSEQFLYDLQNRARELRSTFGSRLLEEYQGGFTSAKKSSGSQASEVIFYINSWLEDHSDISELPKDNWGEIILEIANGNVLPLPTTELRELLTEIDKLSEKEIALGQFLSQIEPLGKDIAQSISDGVRIMTMGGSKGLTVRATIVAGVEDGLVPFPKASLAEERRLLFVAMTRPREFLFCTWARKRFGPTARLGAGGIHKRRHSPFLDNGPVKSEDGNRYLSRNC